MSEDLEALQFVSNVIELKPDKKYLMIFKNMEYYVLGRIEKVLRDRGFDCLCLALDEGQDFKVIEAYKVEKTSLPDGSPSPDVPHPRLGAPQ